MATQANEIAVVIGPGSIGQAIARRVGAGRTLLLAAHSTEATEAWFEHVRDVCAAQRFVTPDEIGDAAAFLLGRQAGFVTGADLLMDGGVTAALRTGELTTTP